MNIQKIIKQIEAYWHRQENFFANVKNLFNQRVLNAPLNLSMQEKFDTALDNTFIQLKKAAQSGVEIQKIIKSFVFNIVRLIRDRGVKTKSSEISELQEKHTEAQKKAERIFEKNKIALSELIIYGLDKELSDTLAKIKGELNEDEKKEFDSLYTAYSIFKQHKHALGRKILDARTNNDPSNTLDNIKKQFNIQEKLNKKQEEKFDELYKWYSGPLLDRYKALDNREYDDCIAELETLYKKYSKHVAEGNKNELVNAHNDIQNALSEKDYMKSMLNSKVSGFSKDLVLPKEVANKIFLKSKSLLQNMEKLESKLQDLDKKIQILDKSKQPSSHVQKLTQARSGSKGGASMKQQQKGSIK